MRTVTLSRSRLEEILQRVRGARICLIGDLCVDAYWYADMRKSQLSRETPQFPLPVVAEKYSPGAGGNVVQNIAALGAEVLPVSVIGDDWRGYLLRRLLEERKVDTARLYTLPGHVTPCYCKPMKSGISDVVYEDPRIDFENDRPLPEQAENELVRLLRETAAESDLIVVCDQFRNGVITERVREELERLSGAGKTVIADSRDRIGTYKDVILKPNEVEAAQALGLPGSAETLPLEECGRLAERLRRKNGKPVILTLGERGAVWCGEDGEEPVYAPAVKAEGPCDIVGAGDTFLASFACAMAAGVSGGEALALGNLASGVTVRKIGQTGTASPDEIRRIALERKEKQT